MVATRWQKNVTGYAVKWCFQSIWTNFEPILTIKLNFWSGEGIRLSVSAFRV